MPDFSFTSPEGKTYTLTGPEGATKEQAFGIFRQQHPELFQGPSGGGSATSGATQQPPAQTPAQVRASLPPVLQGVSPPIQSNDPGAATLHGLLGVPVEAGRLVNQFGAKPMGWDLSKLVPPSMQRGWDILSQQANKGGGSQIAETVGSTLPFMGLGPLEALPWLGKAALRSVLPSLLQPTQGDISPGEKVAQTILGTAAGEGLHGVSKLAGLLPDRWRREAADYLKRAIDETLSRQTARSTEEQAQRKAFTTTQAEHEATAKTAAEVEQRNLARRQAVERQNAMSEREYQGARAQHQIDTVRQLDIPRQATQGLLNDARGLIGERPLEFNLTHETAPQVRQRVGDELNRIYGRMSFDPNKGGWMGTAQRVQSEIDNLLRQSPDAQALWQRTFQNDAFMPGLRAEAGARAPVAGVAPGTVRSPTGERFPQRSLPTGELQGPMGTRSGEISGQQLSMLMSRITKAQQEFGLAAQRGGGAVMGSIADGLSQMRRSMEAQLDARFPRLAKQRQAANQAYFLTSRVMDAIGVDGSATPEQLLQAFKNAEGDTRFGTDQRFADIKKRLQEQRQEHTAKLEPPKPPTATKGYDEPVPKVSKAPDRPGPLPQIKPVPLQPGPGESLAHGTAALAGETAGHLGHATGIPGVAPAARGLVRALVQRGKPALDPVLRGARSATRAAALPATIGTSRLTDVVASQQRRRRQERERQRSSQ